MGRFVWLTERAGASHVCPRHLLLKHRTNLQRESTSGATRGQRCLQTGWEHGRVFSTPTLFVSTEKQAGARCAESAWRMSHLGAMTRESTASDPGRKRRAMPCNPTQHLGCFLAAGPWRTLVQTEGGYDMTVELNNVSGARILDRMGLKLASARFPPDRFDVVAGRSWRAAGLACGEQGWSP